MNFSRAFDGLAYIFFAALLFVPFGIWKVIEIIIWIIHHFDINYVK